MLCSGSKATMMLNSLRSSVQSRNMAPAEQAEPIRTVGNVDERRKKEKKMKNTFKKEEESQKVSLVRKERRKKREMKNEKKSRKKSFFRPRTP